jgi:hypothetical protein
MPCDYGVRFTITKAVDQRGQIAEGWSRRTGQAQLTWVRPFAFEHSNLLAQRENFERSVRASAEENRQGGHDCEEQIEHTDVVSLEPGHHENESC